MSMKKITRYCLAILLFLLQCNAVFSASYDCAKANTTTEKLICRNDGLSNLDDKLAAVYLKAKEKAPDIDKLISQQVMWLKERNNCQDIACIQGQYELRIGELERVVSLVPLPSGQESYAFTSETEKLKVIQDVVRRESFKPLPDFLQDATNFCETFMQDFIAGKNIVAVEPEFTTNDNKDPRFSDLNQCIKYTREEGVSDMDFNNVGLLGDPPYRYYKIEIDGNQGNGKEIVIYHETPPSTGYKWVDVNSCRILGGAAVQPRQQPAGGIGEPRRLYRQNILALYRDTPVSIELSPSRWRKGVVGYSVGMTYIDSSKVPRACLWLPE